MQKVIYQRPNHFSYLKVMREQNQLCDIIIEIETQLFPVHKCIMAGTMEYFKAIFLDDFKENAQEIISINNITAMNMKALIDFAYNGEIVLTEDTVESLMKAADYLLLIEVKEQCAKFLESTLNCTNVCKVYCMAEELSCISLKEQSYMFMREHVCDIVQSKEFLSFNHSFITDLVIDNDQLSPTTEFEALMRWIINNFDERKIHLSEILSCSNFFKLTSEYLNNYVFAEDVIAAMPELEHKIFLADVLLLYRNLKKKNIPKEHIIMMDMDGTTNIYDPYNNKWKSMKSTGSVTGHANFVVHENQLYKIGGKDPLVLYRYNLQEKKWKILSSINIECCISAGIGSLDDYLYVCGGYNGYDSLNDVIRYCPTTKEWRQMSSMQTVRCDMTVVAFSGHLYAIGGYNNNCKLDTVECYDPQRDCWATLLSVQKKRRRAGAAVLNGKIFVCGGLNDNTVEAYDPIVNRWDLVAPMNVARYGHLVVAAEGKLWSFGGYNEELGNLSSVEVYHSEQDSWSYVSEMPTCKGIVYGGVLLI